MRGVSPVTIRTEVSRFEEDHTNRRTPEGSQPETVSSPKWFVVPLTQSSMSTDWIMQYTSRGLSAEEAPGIGVGRSHRPGRCRSRVVYDRSGVGAFNGACFPFRGYSLRST